MLCWGFLLSQILCLILQEAARWGEQRSQPADGSTPETPPLRHVATLRSVPWEPETHCALRESFFLPFQKPQMLSKQIPEPDFAPDFFPLIPYVRSTAVSSSSCSP